MNISTHVRCPVFARDYDSGDDNDRHDEFANDNADDEHDEGEPDDEELAAIDADWGLDGAEADPEDDWWNVPDDDGFECD